MKGLTLGLMLERAFLDQIAVMQVTCLFGSGEAHLAAAEGEFRNAEIWNCSPSAAVSGLRLNLQIS
jgi:hypothetical protein